MPEFRSDLSLYTATSLIYPSILHRNHPIEQIQVFMAVRHHNGGIRSAQQLFHQPSALRRRQARIRLVRQQERSMIHQSARDVDTLRLPANVLKSMIRQTLFAIADSNAKPIH